MGSKNKPCKGEYDMPNLTSPTQVHGKSHMRQFSTKSKAKGSASFKGLRRVLTHDGTFEGDGLLNRHGSFKKSKSSDALYRRRAISGLNMTALVGEKPTNRVSRSQGNSRLSSPIQSLSKSHSSSNVAHSLASAIGGSGLRPRRTRSTHSVLTLRQGQEFYDNESTTDEEVEHFTDEEAQNSDSSDNIHHTRPKSSRMLSDDRIRDQQLSVIQSSPEDIITLNGNPNQGKGDSYSTLRAHNSIDHSKNTNKDFDGNSSDDKIEAMLDDVHLSKASNKSIDHVNVKDDHEDHIGEVDPNSLSFDSHSLVRQERKPRTLAKVTEGEESIADDMNKNRSPIEEFTKKDGEYQSKSDEPYIPDMILSQSTGVERKFENPSSIQNSLAKEIQNTKYLEDSDNTTDAPSKPIKNISGFDKDEIENGRLNDTKHSMLNQQVNAKSELTNNLQKVNSDNNPPRSSLTNTIFQKSRNQYASRTDTTEKGPTSLLKTDRDSNSTTKINNFSQFLKSENIDGNSRTQRKMLLQRESSILDLNSQTDSAEAIFMTGHIEQKREYEKITHEYTTLRRYTNPLDKSLLRLKNSKKSGKTNSTYGNSGLEGSSISTYSNQVKELDDFLPKAQQSKLNSILASIWRSESQSFNKDVNPLNRNKSSMEEQSNHYSSLKNSLKSNIPGSGTGLHQQRVPKMQPTTRAVHRRMENSNTNLAAHFR